MPEPSLMINEIYRSIQGESTWAGLPCTFVRLTGCHLRCAYCDTEYAFHQGSRMTLDAILDQVNKLSPAPHHTSPPHALRLVEITGGEPLLQPNIHPLMSALCDQGHTVLIETSGACDISPCDPRVIRIMDLKTPGSGEVDHNDWNNIQHLTPHDEIKFVLTSEDDYQWARKVIEQHDLIPRVHSVLMSAVHAMPAGNELAGCTSLSLADLAAWVLADGLCVRLQTQLHKIIWHPTQRGV